MGEGSHPESDNEADLEAKLQELVQRRETLTLRLHQLAKPTIAVLPGVAAEPVFASPSPVICVSPVSRHMTTGYRNIGFRGITAAAGCSANWWDPRGPGLYFTGRRVAAGSLQLGIFNGVVPDAQLPEVASTGPGYRRRACPGPGLYEEEHQCGPGYGSAQHLALEAERLRCADTADHREAVSAFMEKRPPVFNQS